MSIEAGRTVVLIACVAAASCTAPAVKTVVADKASFLDKNFASSSIRPAVATTIAAKDSASLPFKKMTFKVTLEPQFKDENSSRPERGGTITFINAGGPYVQKWVEETSNQLPYLQTYMLSYRGLVSVRWQDVPLNGTTANDLFEVKYLKPIPAWPTQRSSGDLNYEYQYGFGMQIMNFISAHVRCSLGETFSASRIHPKLLGEAQLLDCETLNRNGVVASRSKEALLYHYGITFMTRLEKVSSASDIKVIDVSVE